MLTPYLPYPPSSGGQVRSYNLIKNLSKYHEITLFSLIKNDEEKIFIKELEKYCKKVLVFSRPAKPWTLKNIIRTGFSLFPFLVIRNLSLQEKKALTNELKNEKYDLIHAETFYVMPHIPETDIPILLVDQTIEFQVYQHFVKSNKKWFLKPFLYLDIYKIKYWELKFWRKANKVVAVSESDREKMIKLVPGLNVGIVPNGAGEDLLKIYNERKTNENKVVFFQANFSWLQNIEAAENLAKKVFPLILKIEPKAKCLITGQNALRKINYLKDKQIEIVDLENSDIEGVLEAYKRATIFVAPLEGPGGTRLKVLGAMAAGVPIVTSKIGIEGIDASDNINVLLANSWKDMAEKSVLLLKDKKLYSKLVVNARKLIEDKYSYKSIAETLQEIYKEVANIKNNKVNEQ